MHTHETNHDAKRNTYALRHDLKLQRETDVSRPCRDGTESREALETRELGII